MSWVYELTRDAEEDLRDLPKAIQKRVARVLTQMEADPLAGNVKALQGKTWQGVYRRRIGDYRLIFRADHPQQKVFVLRILIRSGGTYQ
jgi:mRNA interferase RelE/StbE